METLSLTTLKAGRLAFFAAGCTMQEPPRRTCRTQHPPQPLGPSFGPTMTQCNSAMPCRAHSTHTPCWYTRVHTVDDIPSSTRNRRHGHSHSAYTRRPRQHTRWCCNPVPSQAWPRTPPPPRKTMQEPSLTPCLRLQKCAGICAGSTDRRGGPENPAMQQACTLAQAAFVHCPWTQEERSPDTSLHGSAANCELIKDAPH